MQWDFWNNPLVVSAVRLKYRRGSPGLTASLYLLVLISIGLIIYYNRDEAPIPPARMFLVIVFGIQFLISGGLAVFSVMNSLNVEVVTRTLDFQRIVSLSPSEILIGKVIGEPVLSYFLVVVTIPLAVFCWTLGAATAWSIVWLYLNLATSLWLLATLGTLRTLVPPTTSTGKQRATGSLVFLFLFPLFILQILLMAGLGVFQDSWSEPVVNFLTPLGSITGLSEGDPWEARVELWGAAVYSLYVVPVVQIGLAFCALGAMSRRLKNTLDPPLTKGRAYVALLLFDFVVAGVCYTRWLAGSAAENLMYMFALAHMGFALLLSLGVTPARAGMMSWVWKIRARQPWIREHLLGDRSPVTLVLPMFCIIGAVALSAGFVLPTYWTSTPMNKAAGAGDYVEVVAVISVLLLALGFTYQFLVVTGARGAVGGFILLVFLANIVPPMASFLLEDYVSNNMQELMTGMSPVAFGISRAISDPDLTSRIEGLMALYACLLAVSAFSLRRWLTRQEVSTENKLREMGVHHQVEKSPARVEPQHDTIS